jgi:hypothetical protein
MVCDCPHEIYFSEATFQSPQNLQRETTGKVIASISNKKLKQLFDTWREMIYFQSKFRGGMVFFITAKQKPIFNRTKNYERKPIRQSESAGCACCPNTSGHASASAERQR